VDAATDALASALQRLQTLDARLVLLALVLQVTNVALRGTAWWGVIRAAHPDRRVPLGGVLCAYTAGMAANTVLPARGGDGVKAVLVRRRLPGACIATIAGTMLVTALFDSIAGVLALTGAWAAGLAHPPQPPHVPPLVLAGGALAAVVLVVLAHARIGDRLRRLAGDVRRGGAILRTPRRYLTHVASLQACSWCCRVAVAYTLLHAFHIPAGIGEAVAVTVLGGLTAAVPAAPGGIGTQQLVVVYALQRVATATAALSFAVGMQASLSTLNSILGICALLILFRTARPLAALRATRALAGGT
jgi:glycosyltransferase 2 family protein